MNVLATTIQISALLLATFMWAMALAFVLKIASGYFSVAFGKRDRLTGEVVAVIAFKIACLVTAGVWVLQLSEALVAVIR